MTGKPIATWLLETRSRHKLTQEQLIESMSAAGWAPYRSNYSKYENGKATPEPETLAHFVSFWAGRGEPGPDLEPRTEPAPVDPLVAALAAQTAALTALVDELRSWRTEDRDRLRDVEATVKRLVQPALAERETATRVAPPALPGTAG